MLEVRNLVRPKKESLLSLLEEMCPALRATGVEGNRSYARVRIAQQDEILVRRMVKDIARHLGKKVSSVYCTEVVDLRLYNSANSVYSSG